LSIPVLSLRDEIRDTLASWTADVMDRWRLAGPPGVGVYTDRPPVGPPGLTRDARDRLIVMRCASWLLAQAEPFAAHEAVAVAYTELSALLTRAHQLAPWRPAPTLIDGVPCRCMATALHDHGDDGIVCWRCGVTYTRDSYQRLLKVLDHRVRTDPGLMATATDNGWKP
jgi:hypothetical protein